jgi:hypothetical protein
VGALKIHSTVIWADDYVDFFVHKTLPLMTNTIVWC